MSFTVFLGNLPTWVTDDDIKSWLRAEDLVADAIKVIRNHETQESKGFAFIEAPTADEMQAIIRRFDRAPLEDRILRANPAQPVKAKGPLVGRDQGSRPTQQAQPQPQLQPQQQQQQQLQQRRPGGRSRRGRQKTQQPHSAFAEELARAL